MSNYIEVFEKTSAEKLPKTVQYADRMPTGATLSSCAVAATKVVSGATDNTVISSTSATISGSNASVFVQNGTDGFRYEVKFTATLSDTTVLVDKLLMIVED